MSRFTALQLSSQTEFSDSSTRRSMSFVAMWSQGMAGLNLEMAMDSGTSQ